MKSLIEDDIEDQAGQHVIKDASNEEMNLQLIEDFLQSGQRSPIDEEILALSQSNCFGRLEEKKSRM
ncbi:hypothetical protein QYM36_010155, partial [Artemia franciscana]